MAVRSLCLYSEAISAMRQTCFLFSCVDPWLHRKSRKSSKNKSRTGSPDSSYNALAAAGLKVGGLPWSTPGQRTKQPNGLESQHSWNPAGN